MLEDTPIPNGFSPIQKTTADQRVATFQANSNSIYNKYTPFTTYSFGPSQPFVYTKISDSNLLKNLTKYDSQASPIGSTVRDLQRIGKYSITGNGLKFFSNQASMQNANAFNETRIYNPFSLLKATAKPGSFGLIEYPIRHMETVGLDFFRTAILSTLGIQSCEMEAQSTNPIDGTATGLVSDYASGQGGSRAGKLRLNTAMSADARFSKTWIANTTSSKNGTFLQNLLNGLIKNLKSKNSGTNPRWRSGVNGNPDLSWEFRPEYPNGNDGAYHVFLDDKSALLKTSRNSVSLFYKDKTKIQFDGKVSDYHKYSPQKQKRKDTIVWYADDDKIINEVVGIKDTDGNINNLEDLHKRMVKSIDSFQGEKNQFRRSAERYSEVKVKNPDGKETSYPTYKDIPGKGSTNEKFESLMQKAAGIITLDDRMFAKVSDYKQNSLANASDGYNEYDVIKGERETVPNELLAKSDQTQSQDLIFFYFYDLINKIYVPFRATITSLSDQHSAEWEDINYIGRADKLFLYKGFSRDVNFSFTVYANSATEMLPMWNRINYLVGFTKPSKYTGKATVTNDAATGDTSGKESSFIYPPMVTLRLGDLFYDQPCVVSNVGVNIPDDTNWESLRGEEYSYIASPTTTINIGTKSRQLPMKVDVSISLKLMEKRQALGSDAHYGNASYNADGTVNKRWLL